MLASPAPGTHRWKSTTALARVPSHFAVPLLLALFLGLAMSSLPLKGATFDEPVHLGAGYTHLTRGDFRMNAEHPPLAKLLAAAPLLLHEVAFSPDWPEWVDGTIPLIFGTRFLYDENDADALLWLGRLPMLVLGCLLGWCVWGWTREAFGRGAAHLALALYALSPNFLAHARLVTTDVAAATFMFACAWAAWRTCRRWTLTRALTTAAALGAALASKYSAVLLLPVLTVYGAWRVVRRQPWPMRLPWREKMTLLRTLPQRLALVLATSLCTAALAIGLFWACYGFRFAEPLRPDGSSFYDWSVVEQQQRVPAAAIHFLRRHRLLPEPSLYGVSFMLSQEHRYSFLNGQLAAGKQSGYFLHTFLLKTPLPLLALLAVGLLCRPRRGGRLTGPVGAVLLPAVFYFAAALNANINIGHRHLLLAYPYLFAVAGLAASRLALTLPGSVVVALLLGWQVREVASVHPHYLAYFNQLAGGPEGGWQHLVDSNLDWGQDLPGLKQWMDDNEVEQIKLSYFGTGVPEYYGINYQRLPSYRPLRNPDTGVPVVPGDLIAVSATLLQGVYMFDEHFLRFAKQLRTRVRPLAHIGHSIFIYRIPD